MRQIKFRVWYEKPEWEKDGKSQYVPKGAFVHSVYVEKPIADDVYTYEQFTGLLDKNGIAEVYEGDIIDAYGNIKGNIHQMDKGEVDLVIEGFGTKTWTETEKAGLGRGLTYP